MIPKIHFLLHYKISTNGLIDNPLLCWRHTVPKLTPDGHTNMEFVNFARRWPRTWSTANEQRKQVRCQQKVTRWHPNHTRRQHEDVNFYSSLYQQDTRRPHDGYTTSYWEYDAFELEHEGVTWPPDGIKLSAVGNSVADRRHDDNNN